MADEGATQEAQAQEGSGLDPRVERVINVIALHIGTFHQQGRTGELVFKVKFDEGNIPQKGYSQTIDEDVL